LSFADTQEDLTFGKDYPESSEKRKIPMAQSDSIKWEKFNLGFYPE